MNYSFFHTGFELYLLFNWVKKTASTIWIAIVNSASWTKVKGIKKMKMPCKTYKIPKASKAVALFGL